MKKLVLICAMTATLAMPQAEAGMSKRDSQVLAGAGGVVIIALTLAIIRGEQLYKKVERLESKFTSAQKTLGKRVDRTDEKLFQLSKPKGVADGMEKVICPSGQCAVIPEAYKPPKSYYPPKKILPQIQLRVVPSATKK